MKVIFPNSAWVPAPERFVLRRGRWKRVQLKVRYGVIIHPIHGVILVDTGYTKETLSHPDRSWLLRLYSTVLSFKLNDAELPETVLSKLGFAPADVRYIIVTHFHPDHISGLKQFSNAQFIADAAAYETVKSNTGFQNLRHGIFPELLPKNFEDRLVDVQSLNAVDCGYGLDKGRDIFGDGDLIAVDLPGHADGHFGVLINMAGTPILYAADVQWLSRAVTQDRIAGYPMRLIADDFAALKQSSARVASFARLGHDMVYCHDPEGSKFDFDADKGH